MESGEKIKVTQATAACVWAHSLDCVVCQKFVTFWCPDFSWYCRKRGQSLTKDHTPAAINSLNHVRNQASRVQVANRHLFGLEVVKDDWGHDALVGKFGVFSNVSFVWSKAATDQKDWEQGSTNDLTDFAAWIYGSPPKTSKLDFQLSKFCRGGAYDPMSAKPNLCRDVNPSSHDLGNDERKRKTLDKWDILATAELIIPNHLKWVIRLAKVPPGSLKIHPCSPRFNLGFPVDASIMEGCTSYAKMKFDKVDMLNEHLKPVDIRAITAGPKICFGAPN